MKHLQTFNESIASSLDAIMDIRTNMPDADFYITRKGSAQSLGMPSKPGDPNLDMEKFGVRCNREVLLPDYLFYMVQYLHQCRKFEIHAHGTTRLQTLRLTDVKLVIAQGLMRQGN